MKRFLAALLLCLGATGSVYAAVAVMSTLQQVGQPVPSLSNVGNTVTYTTGGSAVALDSVITLNCNCSTVTSATISISNGLLALDALNFANQNSIVGVYDSGTGILTLNGTDTIAHYQTALQSITYSSTALDPTNSGADPTRTISWQVVNGSFNSGTSTTTVAVQVSGIPTVNNANNTVGYVAGGSAVVLDPAITVACTCSNITAGTVTLNVGFFAGDTLNFTNQLGITGSYNSGTGVLTLSGTTTLANYTTALASITYSSSAPDPTNSGVAQTKTALWVVSNAGTLSAPVPTTTVNVTLPGQPSWAPPGSIVAVNGQTNQAWISGTGTVGLNTQLTVTRAGAETCQGTTTAYQAIANQGCTSNNGLAIWGGYTNYLQHSVDLSNAAWIQYTTGAGVATIAGNSVVAPDGTTTAAKITVARNTTGENAQYIENSWQNTATGQYSAGIWLKADGSGDVGKKVTLHTYDGATARDFNFTLTAAWTYYTSQNFAMDSCTSHSGSSCQFGIGFSSAAGGNNTTLSVNVDAWGGEVNTGPVTFPFIPTTVASVASLADNIAVATGSALETVLSGAASTVFVNTFGAINGSTPATILDSNGTIWLGQANSAKLTTALDGSLTTTGAGDWSLAQAPALARSGAGRTMALGRTTVWAKDTQATTVATPIHVGSTSGSSAFFNGYVQLIVAYDSRLADTAIGVSGAGGNYYFATAGSDAANCLTTGTACQTLTKANSLTYVTNDTLHFNKGDTFTGCLNLTGGTNWQATTGAPGTVTSYGTGAAPIITPNCTAGSAKIGAVNLRSVDGLVWDGVNVVGDTAGAAGRGISIKNCDANAAHGTITIENSTFTISHDGLDADFGGALFFDQSCSVQKINHVSILNNTFDGASPSSTMDNGITSYGFASRLQYDAIQGNVFRNIGGKASGANGAEGNGALINGVTDALTVQFNYVTHVGGNTNTCGGPYGLWANASSNITFSYNEVSLVGPVAYTAGCDWGGFDADVGTNSITFDHNYTHDNFGPGILIFSNAGSHKIMWNISSNDATFATAPSNFGGASITLQSATGTVDVLFNTIYSATSTYTGHYQFAEYYTCGALNLLVANNIFAKAAKDSSNVTRLVSMASQAGACSGSVIFKNNAYYFPAGSLFNIYAAVGYTSLAAWQAAIPGGETSATSANPTWVTPIGSITCYVSGTPAGPQPCPAGYALGGGSTYKNTGLDVTAPPYSRSVGSTDYFGVTVPTGVGTGYPIGASN